MPIGSVIFLLIAIGALTIFAAVLAYAENATRLIPEDPAAAPASASAGQKTNAGSAKPARVPEMAD